MMGDPDPERYLLLSKKPSRLATLFKFVTCQLVITSVVCLSGCFQIGYQQAITTNTQNVVQDFINKTLTEREGTPPSQDRLTSIMAITVSILLLGAGVGSFVSKWVSAKCSRKKGLWLAVLLGYVSAPFYFLFRYLGFWELFLIGRLLVGVQIGLYSALVPIYLAEISPKEIRGAISSLNPVTVVIAVLTAQVVGYPEILGTNDLWVVSYGLLLVPCVLQTLLLPFSVESPSYLMIIKGDAHQAKEALRDLRQSSDVEEEMKELGEEMKISQKQTASWSQLFKYPPYRRPTVLVLFAHATFQLSGGPAVQIFANSLSKDAANLSGQWAAYSASTIGLTAVLFTILNFLLVDVIGRRSLQLLGIFGSIVGAVLATVCLILRHSYYEFGYASVAFLIVYSIFFNLGPGAIPWIIMGEYLPQETRPLASSISVMTNYFLGFLVVYLFPFMQESICDYVLVPFIVFMVVVFFYFYLRMPETKGKTIDQIAEMFQ